jgi:hypothetical protein
LLCKSGDSFKILYQSQKFNGEKIIGKYLDTVKLAQRENEHTQKIKAQQNRQLIDAENQKIEIKENKIKDI